MIERRREPRVRSEQQVLVTRLADLKVSLAGELADTSTSGLGLTLAARLEAGVALSVEWDDKLALGAVVYCTKTGEQYHAGIKVDYLVLDRSNRSREMSWEKMAEPTGEEKYQPLHHR